MKPYFKQDDQIRLVREKLCEAFMPTLKRGDILLWADIEKVVGESRAENRAKYIIKTFRSRVLNEMNIFLKSVVNVGLKACSPEEQVEHGGVVRQRKAMRQARRGLKEVRAVEPGDLSLHQQRIRASSIDQLKLTQRMARRGAKETSAIKKPEPLPRIAFVKSAEVG